MNVIVEKEIGSDGAKAELLVGEGKLALQVSYPIAKIVDPLAVVVDKVVDRLEQWIPGDQKELAAKLKQEAREEIADFLAKAVV